MPKPASPPHLATIGGVYYVFWRDGQLKRERRRSLGTDDAIEAAKRFAAWLGATEAGLFPSGRPGPARLTVKEVVERYLAEHAELKSAAIRRTRVTLRHVVAYMGPVTIDEVDIGLCRRYLAHRTAQGVSGSTVRRELAMLSAAANHAARWKHIARTDLPVIELPPASPPRDRWLSFEEWERLLEASSLVLYRTPAGSRHRPMTEGDRLPRLYRFVALAYWTASRRRALEELRWDQVDFERELIHLNPRGRRQSAKRRGIVPIHPRLREILERAWTERTGPFVLDNDADLIQGFGRLVARAGLGRDVTPHTLRHTRATHLAIRGVRMEDIADLLGDTVDTVRKHYRHLSPGHLRAALEDA